MIQHESITIGVEVRPPPPPPPSCKPVDPPKNPNFPVRKVGWRDLKWRAVPASPSGSRDLAAAAHHAAGGPPPSPDVPDVPAERAVSVSPHWPAASLWFLSLKIDLLFWEQGSFCLPRGCVGLIGLVLASWFTAMGCCSLWLFSVTPFTQGRTKEGDACSRWNKGGQ